MGLTQIELNCKRICNQKYCFYTTLLNISLLLEAVKPKTQIVNFSHELQLEFPREGKTLGRIEFLSSLISRRIFMLASAEQN